MVAYARTLGLELPTAQGALGSFTEAAQSGLEGQDAISVPVRWAGKTGARS
jgi:hypothetical protein